MSIKLDCCLKNIHCLYSSHKIRNTRRIKKLTFVCLLTTSSSAFALLSSPYTYLNYLQDLKVAKNAVHLVEQQAQQIRNQIKSIAYAIKNTNHLSRYQWRDISRLMQKMDRLTQQGQAISYATQNLDKQFRSHYRDYGALTARLTPYAKTYQHWTSSTLDTLKNSMKAARMSASQFQNEQTLLSQLKSQSQSAGGRMQILQVSNEIEAEHLNQLQSLKRSLLAQSNARNAFMAYNVSKDAYRQRSLKDMVDKVPKQFPSYQDHRRFGLFSLN